MLLAGDIGGTKTRLAVFDKESGPRDLLAEAVFASRQYPSLEAIIRDFLGEHHVAVTRAAFGVAGPVLEGETHVTNLPWVVNEHKLESGLGMEKVDLINDIVAVGTSIQYLEEQETEIIQEGEAKPGGSVAVIAPGTGLGEGFLTWDGARYHAFGSEGGHTDFGPKSPLELGLMRYLQEKFGHVSYERICSGSGLPNIYHYLKDGGYAAEPLWLKEKLEGVVDPTPIIVQAALDTEKLCDLCQATLHTFVAILGAEAGNLALKVLATGGVYLGGGIPPRILPALKDGRFLNAFLNKGRFADLMINIPVKIILNNDAALLGAAYHMLQN